MLLRETLVTVLATPAVASAPGTEVPRRVLDSLRRTAGHALVLTGARLTGARPGGVLQLGGHAALWPEAG